MACSDFERERLYDSLSKDRGRCLSTHKDIFRDDARRHAVFHPLIELDARDNRRP
jgi:hypothetical protein